MTNRPTSWKHDPTEPFARPVYRKGPWHFQASPVAMLMLLFTWLGMIAVFLPVVHSSTFQEYALFLRFVVYFGLLNGGLMTLMLTMYHRNRWAEKKAYRPHLLPCTIGIVEHTTVVLFLCLGFNALVFL